MKQGQEKRKEGRKRQVKRRREGGTKQCGVAARIAKWSDWPIRRWLTKDANELLPSREAYREQTLTKSRSGWVCETSVVKLCYDGN